MELMITHSINHFMRDDGCKEYYRITCYDNGWFSPKSVDISPNIYYNLGEIRDAWEKGDGGSDERI
jgi:hypothetical protein